jgi:hypothetical protein
VEREEEKGEKESHDHFNECGADLQDRASEMLVMKVHMNECRKEKTSARAIARKHDGFICPWKKWKKVGRGKVQLDLLAHLEKGWDDEE